MTAALSAAIFATGIPVLAQTAPDPGTTATTPAQGRGMKGDHMQMMAKRLNLSQQQQDQLKPIFDQTRQQAQAIKNDTSLTQDQKKEKLQALRQSTQSQVNGILTPEQQQQWAQMKQNGMQRMKEGRQRGAQRMAQKLNLSQDQQNQIQPIMQKQREQAKAIWQDNSLSKDQKNEKLQALRQETHSQINSILTEEQQQQWQEMQKNRQQFRQNRHGFGQQQQPPQGA